MTAKRFIIVGDDNIEFLMQAKLLLPIYDDNRGRLSLKTCCDLLNCLNEENKQLKKDIEYYKTERLALFEYLDKKDDLKLELKVEK